MNFLSIDFDLSTPPSALERRTEKTRRAVGLCSSPVMLVLLPRNNSQIFQAVITPLAVDVVDLPVWQFAMRV